MLSRAFLLVVLLATTSLHYVAADATDMAKGPTSEDEPSDLPTGKLSGDDDTEDAPMPKEGGSEGPVPAPGPAEDGEEVPGGMMPADSAQGPGTPDSPIETGQSLAPPGPSGGALDGGSSAPPPKGSAKFGATALTASIAVALPLVVMIW
jgi:hypothetical protein